jgi:AraC-like DNA-binding protein
MPRIANAVRALQTIWAREGIALIPLARWAAELGYSREHLCRVIRGELGCTPREFMQALRCHQAIHLLQASNLRVKQIAVKLGFNSATHLARLLRRNYGMSPKSLRRMAGPNSIPPSRLPLPLEEGLSLFWDPEILRLE